MQQSAALLKPRNISYRLIYLRISPRRRYYHSPERGFKFAEFARGNNPIKYTDPNGEFIFIPFVIAAAVVTAGGIGVATNMPSKEEHYNRNENNVNTDASGNKITTLEQAKKMNYEQLGLDGGEKNAEGMDNYHEMGTGTPNPGENDKFVLPDENGKGSSELIFDKDGNLVEDSINGGTYNLVDAEKSKVGHAVKDVLPYYIHGNDEVDAQTTTMWERIRGTYKGEIPPPPVQE